MDWLDKRILRTLLVPGGILVAAASVALGPGWLALSESSINFYYYGALAAGILLALRFHSSRIVFTLLTLLLAQRALAFFSGGRIFTGPGHIAMEALSVLVPLNFVLFSFAPARGLILSSIFHGLGLIFFESVFVAVICRPGEASGPVFLHPLFLGKHWVHWAKMPPLGVIAFGVAGAILLARVFLYRKPVESGFFWALATTFLFFHSSGTKLTALAYLATAALVLLSSIIENSYFLAYQDELTALPGRRAFNEALLALQERYVIAGVDIDHFKSFNDTYGHDTGDQVLRMVAAKLASVEGGGQVFRVGGEEFSILFAGKSMKDVLPHLESLRLSIQDSTFQVRTTQDRRSVPHGMDRRRPSARKQPRRAGTAQHSRYEISVTVSIGVAEPTKKSRTPEQVIRVADKALYAAKQAGRNQVATANSIRTHTARAAG